MWSCYVSSKFRASSVECPVWERASLSLVRVPLESSNSSSASHVCEALNSDFHICEGLCGQYYLSRRSKPLQVFLNLFFFFPFFKLKHVLFSSPLILFILYLLLLCFGNLLVIFGSDSCPIPAGFLLILCFWSPIFLGSKRISKY